MGLIINMGGLPETERGAPDIFVPWQVIDWDAAAGIDAEDLSELEIGLDVSAHALSGLLTGVTWRALTRHRP